jgi:hypothetical protein
VRATTIALERRDVISAAIALALAVIVPMPLLAWTMPTWLSWAGPATGTTMIVATLAAAAFAIARIARPAAATIGSDGVLVERAGRRARFIAYADVARVVRTRGAIDLVVRSGGRARLYVDASVQARLARLVDDSRRGAEDRLPVVSVATGDYRTPQVPAERLFRAVEDPGACVAARAGAACALAPTLDDSGRERIRAAADASAHPELRTLLRVACDSPHDEDALARALSRVSG